MEQVDLFFRNITTDPDDFNRLCKQIKDLIDGKGMIFIIHGSGNNGKSSLIRIIEKIVSVASVPDYALLKNRFSSVSPLFLDKLVDNSINYLLANEINVHRLNPGILKEVVGETTFFRSGKIIRIDRRKKLILITNSDPNDVDVINRDPGLKARCTFIPMNKEIDNPNYKFVDKIIEEHYSLVYPFLENEVNKNFNDDIEKMLSNYLFRIEI